MGLFDFFKSKGKEAPDVLQSLLQAAERRDFKTLARLCGEHQDQIRQSFAKWSKVPDEVRNNPAALKPYAEGLIAVAQVFEQAGDASLVAHLTRTPEDSPLVQWEADLSRAQSLVDGGKLQDAIALLEAILAKHGKLVGTGADFYLPRTLGLLGAAYFRSGDKAKAVEYTSRAKSVCEQCGDREGAAIYEGNLRHLAQQA